MTEAEDRVAVIRALHDAWARGDFALELFHPDVEWSTPHPGAELRGRDDLHSFLRSFMGAWAEYTNELEEIRELPDGRVLVLFTETARGRRSGVETQLSPAALVTIRDGLIVRYEGLVREDALRSVGLER
ncbi:MAG TPA: nuclear transport factor 2 family protein [Thermoleophilaceae bacterium]|nr:nuclear transport factor 2 family protein [Thermoleophilaceae bacterium]